MSIFDIYIADYYSFLEYLAAITAVIILISSIDDLFIDCWYWCRRIYRYWTIKKRPTYHPLRAEDLLSRTEQPLAIMVPAWLEYDVIAQMVENMVSVLNYQQYVIFIGTYVNDEATIKEVERMQRRYRQLKRVEVPHPGPTCKADCLNWIIQAIHLHEKQHNMAFAGVILHDSEDVLHPLELKFFNYLLPRKDMIQLPVMSLERNWFELIAGTYMDEFAEWHAKDLVVRESVSGMVPSAGVGTCFSRRAITALCEQTQNQPFNTETLTEDYDIGARLSAMGMNSIFANFNVQFKVSRPTRFGLGPVKEFLLNIPLCVREYFPNTLRTAYRQKARWVLGIGLQSWEQLGWRGSLITKYLLFRDRKGIVTAFVSIFSYVLLFQFVILYLLSVTHVSELRFPPLFREGTWLFTISVLITIALGLRVVQRVYFVTKLYGWEHGIMSVPRMIIGNVINFFAVSRAWKMFLAYLLWGKKMAWDKTMHDFPTTELLGKKRARLGELLQSWQAVDANQLSAALSDKSNHDMPLGQILIAKGWLDEETLAEAIAFQSDLPRAHMSPEQILQAQSFLSLDACIRWRVIPFDKKDDNILCIATANELSPEMLVQLQVITGCSIEQYIARENEIRTGLRILRHMSHHETAETKSPLLGDLLIEMGLIQRQQFQQAIETYSPNRDGLIGSYLVNLGIVSADNISKALAEQKKRTTNLPLSPTSLQPSL